MGSDETISSRLTITLRFVVQLEEASHEKIIAREDGKSGHGARGLPQVPLNGMIVKNSGRQSLVIVVRVYQL